MVKVTDTKHQRRCILINYYCPPNVYQQAPYDEELKYVVDVMRKRYTDPNLLIAGDFNRDLRRMKMLGEDLNLQVAQNDHDEFVTHVNSANRENSNQLDYFLTNCEWKDTHVKENGTRSDHNPLYTTVGLRETLEPHHGRRQPVTRIKPNLTQQELLRIGRHKDWPAKPAVQVAYQLRLAETVYVPLDDC